MVHQKLQILLWSDVLFAALIVLVGETGVIDLSAVRLSDNVKFITETVMEIGTIAAIPTALKLFKMKKVHAELVEKKEEALRKWGVIRLQMLLLPLVLNVIFYYFRYSPRFAYMAIILLVCLAFVYPSKARCESEIREEA